MSHFAKVDNGRVVQVIVAELDFIQSFFRDTNEKWIQTSYNTRGNIHYGPDGLPDNQPPLRGNYAGIGYIYDSQNDVFYEPQPFPSWTLDKNSWTWQAPIAYPEDGNLYVWDESLKNWKTT